MHRTRTYNVIYYGSFILYSIYLWFSTNSLCEYYVSHNEMSNMSRDGDQEVYE